MKSTSSGLINLAFVWGIASAAAFAAMAGLMLLGGWGLVQAIFAAAVFFFVLGAVLSLLFLKPLPGPQRPGSAGWNANVVATPQAAPAKPAAPARAPAPAPAPVAPAAAPAVAPAPASAPAVQAAAPEVPDAAGTRPAALDGPRAGGADDLKKIKGIGPKLELLCHKLGFYHYDQIANWSAAEVAWVDANLEGFKGRVTRDTWVEQARLLASGAETDFSRKVDKGDVY